MEERKSILETTGPADALGSFSTRRAWSRVSIVLIGVTVLFVLAFLAGAIINTASRGSAGVEIPKVIEQ